MGCCAQDIRIDFQFSKGAFDFSFLPFTIPYPVPFKALGDETKVHTCVLAQYASERTSKGSVDTGERKAAMCEFSACRVSSM